MKRKQRSIIFIFFLFIGLTAVSYTDQPKPHEFENLQVLPENISEEKLDSIMDAFKFSLGVKCGFCHAKNEETQKLDFPSDANPHKDIARKMLRMTAYLNANFFNDEQSTQTDTLRKVVCYTCHRGTKEPDADAFIMHIDSLIMSPKE